MTHRITKVDSGAGALPVTLDEAKAHLRVTEDDEDALISIYLRGAVEWAEEVTHRAISQQSYLVVEDDFPRTRWKLPLGYVASITSIKYLDDDGAEQTWSSSLYHLDNSSDSAATVRPIPTESWPDVGDYPSSARVTMVAGFSTTNCPYSLRMAILQRIGQLSESRAPGDPEADEMERATRDLLAPYVLPIWA